MAERTCIVSGQSLPRDLLIRFVAGPDGNAVADLANRLPGRGVWVEGSAESLRKAAGRGLIQRRIGAGIDNVDTNIEQIAALMRTRALGVAMMARRAGQLVGGAGKLLGEGAFAVLLAAPDASPGQFRKLESKLGVVWTTRVFHAEELGRVCGRPSLAFAAIRGGKGEKLANRLREELMRLERLGVSSACNGG